MGSLTEGDDGANTPLDADAIAGLIPSWVSTRAGLNEVEAANVAVGLQWLATRPPSVETICSSEFTRELHRRMFGDVWSWAGRYRTSDLNIGAEWWAVTEAVEQLVANVAVRLDKTGNGDELDARCLELHHEMVSIHPFLNGNGRHARAMADALAIAVGRPDFTWGSATIRSPGEVRSAYLSAIRSADAGDLEPMVRFARS